MSLLKLENVYKIYKQGQDEILALNNVSLEVNTGEIIVILGSSGSGKTTLLNILSGLDYLDEGKYYFEDKLIAAKENKSQANAIKIKNSKQDSALMKFRKDNLGFIFQTYNLMKYLNVYQNIAIGSKLNKEIKEDDIYKIIDLVGLSDKIKSKPRQLSGGQQQRVAIARALVKKPKILFCDEPTGALDEETSKTILKLIIDLNVKLKTTMIIITHNPVIANIADRIIRIKDGKISKIEENTRKDILSIDWSI